MDVLKESRRQLTAAPSDVCEIICGELASLGKEDSIVELSRGQSSKSSQNPHVIFCSGGQQGELGYSRIYVTKAY